MDDKEILDTWNSQLSNHLIANNVILVAVIKHRNMAIRFHCKLKVARGLQTFKYL
jgi:hypothetical protein